MKKAFLALTLGVILITGGVRIAAAQDQPQPKKDTVNIDTDAKPTFYYAEDEKEKSCSKFPVVAVVAGAVVVVAVGAFLVFRKKKS